MVYDGARLLVGINVLLLGLYHRRMTCTMPSAVWLGGLLDMSKKIHDFRAQLRETGRNMFDKNLKPFRRKIESV